MPLYTWRVRRNALFVAGLVAVAAAVAIGVAVVGGRGGDSEPVATTTVRQADAPATSTAPRAVPVTEEARVVAGQFILWAVSTTATRTDLARSWNLVHPELKAECACSRREWLTGNIPIQPYPVKDLETATFAIDESFEDRVVLQVALLPRDGAEVRGQIFYIGLKAVGSGAGKRWLVDYWAPRQGPDQGVNVAPEVG